jgi:F420-non-reducing hydrogenase small subunit
MAKPKIGLYWCASCGGCEESVVDLAEGLLDVSKAADIVFWPVAVDTKYAEVEKLADGELAACLINGAVRTEEQEKMAKLLRAKSQVVVAHGACAHLGGVVGLANFYERAAVLDKAYGEAPTLHDGERTLPACRSEVEGRELSLPEFHDSVRPLHHVITVDYYLPGCPPPPKLVAEAVTALLAGTAPPAGATFGSGKSLCETCPRRKDKPQTIDLKRFKRLYECRWDASKCFLAEGIICMGPATNGGCGERCINANMPCRGCFGPVGGATEDQGARVVSFLASLVGSDDVEEIKGALDSIPDPAGLFYRYSLAASTLRGRIEGSEHGHADSD